MMHTIRVVLLAIAACIGVAIATADAAEPTFRRGATLSEFFEFPAVRGDSVRKSYADPAYPQALASLSLFDFDELRRTGFDHMRIPLDMGPLVYGEEIQRRQILDDLVTVVSAVTRHRLSVLVTLFPPTLNHDRAETFLDDLAGPKFGAYFAMVERVAKVLAPVSPGFVALEPMNEPQAKCHVLFGTDWTVFQQFMIERLHRIAPDLPLFLTGACGSNIEGIVLLDTDLLRDRRNFVSVHFYYPFLFTHQTATWSAPFLMGTIGVPFPASAGNVEEALRLTRERFKAMTLPPGVGQEAAQARAEAEIRKYFREAQGPAQIDEWMNQVAAWQQRQRIGSDHIVFTEFGAMKQEIDGVEIDRVSRARWLHDTAAAIERHGWGWTVFVLRLDQFGIYSHNDDRYPDPLLLRALHLNIVASPHAAQ